MLERTPLEFLSVDQEFDDQMIDAVALAMTIHCEIHLIRA